MKISAFQVEYDYMALQNNTAKSMDSLSLPD